MPVHGDKAHTRSTGSQTWLGTSVHVVRQASIIMRAEQSPVHRSIARRSPHNEACIRCMQVAPTCGTRRFRSVHRTTASRSLVYCIRLSASTQKLLEWRLDSSSESPAHCSDRPPRTKLRLLLMLCGVITHYIQVHADEINPTKEFRPQSSKLVQKWFIFAVDVGVIFEDRTR